MRNAPTAGSSPFAHLGRSRAASDDEQEEKDKKAKKAKAEDGDEEEGKDEPKGKKAKHAEEDEGDDANKAKGKKAKAAEDDDEEGDEPKGKKAKKAKAEEEDEGDEADESDPDARAARARERRRIRAILVSEPGKANPVAAAHLATGTSMPRGEAIELLSAMQAGQPAPAASAPSTASAAGRDDLRSRMAEVPNASVGGDADRPGLSVAQQIVLAGKKRRGEA